MPTCVQIAQLWRDAAKCSRLKRDCEPRVFLRKFSIYSSGHLFTMTTLSRLMFRVLQSTRTIRMKAYPGFCLHACNETCLWRRWQKFFRSLQRFSHFSTQEKCSFRCFVDQGWHLTSCSCQQINWIEWRETSDLAAVQCRKYSVEAESYPAKSWPRVV